MCLRLTLIVLFLTVAGTVAADGVTRVSLESDPLISASPAFDWNVDVPERNWEFVVIHHSATSRGSVESIHRNHRSRRDSNGQPWLGIGYHFVIGNGDGMPDGRISSTFRWKQQLHGAHCGSLRHNGQGVGVCLIGDFEETKPTAAQLKSVTLLIRMLAGRYEIPAARVLGHRQLRATACPGRFFPFKEVVKEGTRSSVTLHQSPSISIDEF